MHAHAHERALEHAHAHRTRTLTRSRPRTHVQILFISLHIQVAVHFWARTHVYKHTYAYKYLYLYCMYTHTSTRTNTTAHAHTTLSLLSFLSFRRAKKKQEIHTRIVCYSRSLCHTFSRAHKQAHTRTGIPPHTYKTHCSLPWPLSLLSPVIQILCQWTGEGEGFKAEGLS